MENRSTALSSHYQASSNVLYSLLGASSCTGIQDFIVCLGIQQQIHPLRHRFARQSNSSVLNFTRMAKQALAGPYDGCQPLSVGAVPSSCHNSPGVRHLVPRFFVQNTACPLLEHTTPLLEEEWNPAPDAVIANLTHPTRLNWPRTRP